MTDTEIIIRGIAAKNILESDDFCSLFDSILLDLAKDILATPLDGKTERDELHQTCHGMLSFKAMLLGYFNAGEQVKWLAEQKPTDDDI